jgi:hypothetical protein
MHLEFVVLGPPISNQSPGSNLDNWRATVEAEAKKQWNKAGLNGNLKAVIINFHLGSRPSVDIDNMLKPILTFPTKVPSDSLGRIGRLKRTSDKSLFPMALVSNGFR